MANLNNLKIETILTFLPSEKIEIINSKSSDKIRRLSKSIGIERKYVCKEGQTFTDLAVEAVNCFFSKTKLTHDDFDALVLVTQSPDYIIPGSAVLIHSRVGFKSHVAAYDINLGCSGFPYGLFVGYSHLLTGMNRVMIITGDQSYARGSLDEGHGVLFGDSVSICSLTLRSDEVAQQILFGTDGSGYKALYIPEGGKRIPFNKNSLEHVVDETGTYRCGTDVVLDGPKILNFSLKVSIHHIETLLANLNIQLEDIDYFFLHQANKIINETIRKKLNLNHGNCPDSLRNYGNTSSGSIPVTINTSNTKWNEKGKHSIFCGFGIGLSWSTMNYIADGTEKSFLEFSQV